MRCYCYDCGRAKFESFGDGLLWCTHCAELVYPAERVGRLRALLRRALYRVALQHRRPGRPGLAMRQLHIVLTNETRGHSFSEFYEPLEDDETPGNLYRTCQREYGRCTGRVYQETPGRPDHPVGWFFISRQAYEDTGEPYLRGAWVMIEETPIQQQEAA